MANFFDVINNIINKIWLSHSSPGKKGEQEDSKKGERIPKEDLRYQKILDEKDGPKGISGRVFMIETAIYFRHSKKKALRWIWVLYFFSTLAFSRTDSDLLAWLLGALVIFCLLPQILKLVGRFFILKKLKKAQFLTQEKMYRKRWGFLSKLWIYSLIFPCDTVDYCLVEFTNNSHKNEQEDKVAEMRQVLLRGSKDDLEKTLSEIKKYTTAIPRIIELSYEYITYEIKNEKLISSYNHLIDIVRDLSERYSLLTQEIEDRLQSLPNEANEDAPETPEMTEPAEGIANESFQEKDDKGDSEELEKIKSRLQVLEEENRILKSNRDKNIQRALKIWKNDPSGEKTIENPLKHFGYFISYAVTTFPKDEYDEPTDMNMRSYLSDLLEIEGNKFFSDEYTQAVEDCTAFRKDRLPYEDIVIQVGNSKNDILYDSIMKFASRKREGHSTNAKKWYQQHEARQRVWHQEFLDGKFLFQDAFEKTVSDDKINFQQFCDLWDQNFKVFLKIDKSQHKNL